jgi:hypothetical protein
MVVIEAGIRTARELHDFFPHRIGQATVAGPSAVGVSQSRLPVFAHTLLQALNLAHVQTQ